MPGSPKRSPRERRQRAKRGLPCDIPNHASYVADWLEILRRDKRKVVHAAADAQRVADYLLAFPEHAERLAAEARARDGGDVDLGNLHPVKGDDLSVLADVLYVEGTWVYDGGHAFDKKGWNEVHPIKKALVVGHFNGDWSTAIDANNKPLEQHATDIVNALSVVDGAGTRDAQAKPENQWIWHPLVDGCTPDSDGPPPIH